MFWGAFLGAFILRLATAFFWGDTHLVAEWKPLLHYLITDHSYSLAYSDLGFVSTERLSDPAHKIISNYMPPGYPFFLAMFYLVFGFGPSTILVVEGVQVGLSLLTMYALYEIVRVKFSVETASLTALIFALYPLLIFYPSQISAVNIYLTLNMVMVYFLIKGEQHQQVKWLLAAGAFLGLLILSRGQMILYLIVLPAWIYYKIPKIRKRAILAFAVPALLVLLPWSLRNYYQFDRFTPLPFSSGFNLWRGHNSVDIGVYPGPNSQYPSIKEIVADIKNLEKGHKFEMKRDSVFRAAAIDHIKKQPLKAIKGSFKKLFYYWFLEPDYVATHPLYRVPWFLMLPFFVLGIYLSGTNPGNYMIFYLYFIISTGIVMIFFVLPRYRLIIIPFFIVFSSSGILNAFERFRALVRGK